MYVQKSIFQVKFLGIAAAPPRRVPLRHLRGGDSGHRRGGAGSNMAAYLQWRRFVFFDRETVREPSGPDGAGAKPFALPPGITVCDSGRGSLVFGDILCGAGRCGLHSGVRPSRGCVAGESCALSTAGRRGLRPWECGSFPLSPVLCLKRNPNRRWMCWCSGAALQKCLL